MVCRYDGRHVRMIVFVALVALGFAVLYRTPEGAAASRPAKEANERGRR